MEILITHGYTRISEHNDPKQAPARYGLSQQRFLRRARITHGNKYDYGEVKVIDRYCPVKIGCRKHGVFMMPPAKHYLGAHCPTCDAASKPKKKAKPRQQEINAQELRKMRKVLTAYDVMAAHEGFNPTSRRDIKSLD